MKKYVSKSTNFGVVLKNGIQGEPISGRAAVSGVYIRFQDGEAVVTNPEWIELLEKHPSFGVDFIAAETNVYLPPRASEPEHDIVEMTYGAPGRNLNPKGTSEQKTIVEMATAMAKVIAADAIKQAMAEINGVKLAKTDIAIDMPKEKVKAKKAGRPKKEKVYEDPYAEIINPDDIKPAPKKELNPVREE